MINNKAKQGRFSNGKENKEKFNISRFFKDSKNENIKEDEEKTQNEKHKTVFIKNNYTQIRIMKK